MLDVLQQKKVFGHTWRFQGCVGGLNRRHCFDVLLGKLGMDIAPSQVITNDTSNLQTSNKLWPNENGLA